MNRMQGTDKMKEGNRMGEKRDIRMVGNKRKRAEKDKLKGRRTGLQGVKRGRMQHTGLNMDTKVLESDDQLELSLGFSC